MTRPATLADLARTLKADVSALHNALAGFLDDFYTNVDWRQSMIDTAPELIGDAELDAFLDGVGEHLARRWGLRIPA
jgi:hypothetical protein